MVYLIAVDHEVQYLDSDSSSSFSQFLEQKVKQLGVTLIAEELSQEAVVKQKKVKINTIGSTAHHVAEITRIEHRFCDPNNSERESLGIPTTRDIRRKLGLKAGQDEPKVEREKRKYWPKREQFWLDKIIDRVEEKLIFVCGADHIKSFKSLLESINCNVEILSEDWKEE